MTEIRDLLARAADPVVVSAATVDADISRARRALQHRRARRTAGSLLVVGAAGGALTLVRSDTPATREPDVAVARTPVVSRAPKPVATLRTTLLVAYTGAQPSGYRVKSVPQGWEIQGADPFAMTIAPVGFADQQPASFVGKLVVMLRSADDNGPPQGKPVKVGERTGYVSHAEQTAVLTYQDARGHWIQVQVPPSLHWTDEQIASFGAGVEITRDANPGRG
ncbi:MAG: hypothetical protein ABR520_06360 [Mycobacteriales bacterium]